MERGEMKSLRMKIDQFQVVGRKAPTASNPEPKVFRMRIFARNSVTAKSKFWYFMKKLQKVKKTGGEILEVTRIAERKATSIRNYAMWVRYDSNEGTHNMYKEFRDVTTCGAIRQMYNQMAGSHKASAETLQIMRIVDIPDSMCKRGITAFHDKNIKFPFVNELPKIARHKRTRFVRRSHPLFRG